jgi:hypothetical protein
MKMRLQEVLSVVIAIWLAGWHRNSLSSPSLSVPLRLAIHDDQEVP